MSLSQSKKHFHLVSELLILHLCQVQFRGQPRPGEHVRRAGPGHVPRLLPGGLRVPHHLLQDHLHVVAAVGNIRR